MFIVLEGLKLVELKLLGEVINGRLEDALRVGERICHAFRQQPEVLLG